MDTYKILIPIFVFLLSISLVNATCTVTLNKDLYSQGETATVTLNCDAVNEKNVAYKLNWTNGTHQLELDEGTTPSLQGTNFFESFLINSSYVADYGTELNASLIGTNLEGADNATVQQATANDLIISDIQFSTNRFLGSIVGVEFVIKDSNSKKITNADCQVHIDDTDNFPKTVSSRDFHSVDGKAEFSQYISALEFQEGTSYLATIGCQCGLNNTDSACIDEDGNTVVNKIGTASGEFITKTWLTSNTVVDNTNYLGRDEMFICANLTNVEYDKRIAVEIYHQVRCSQGADNDEDRDRALIFSDDGQPDERGISVGATQMQCKRFIVPEPNFMQGRSNECYASTSVWVLDDTRNKIKSYVTSSPKFNITISDLNINADWQQLERNVFNTIINLSHAHYSIYNGTGTGNIDIRLSKDYIESIRAEDQYLYFPHDIHDFQDIEHIINVSAVDSAGTSLTAVIELVDDGHVEIEVRDVDVSPSGYVNVTMYMNNFEERQTDALEGVSGNSSNQTVSLDWSARSLDEIANKTGTFHFSIKTSDINEVGTQLNVQVRALREFGQGDIEAHFICYIDGYQNITEVRWTSAVNELAEYSRNINLPVPETIPPGNYNLKCKIGQSSITNLIHTAAYPIQLTERSTGFLSPSGRLMELLRDKRLAYPLLFILVAGLLLVIASRRQQEEEEEIEWK